MIDPDYDVPDLLTAIQAHDLTLNALHAHIDHAGAVCS
ncbi:hypothetical protein CCP3SC1_830014 [Gammaproteobacteria bacterium]